MKEFKRVDAYLIVKEVMRLYKEEKQAHKKSFESQGFSLSMNVPNPNAISKLILDFEELTGLCWDLQAENYMTEKDK